MWAKTMVYSTTSAADGRTELTVGNQSITVGVDYSTLDDDELRDQYSTLQSFSSDARSPRVIAETIVSSCWVLLPLFLIATLPWGVAAFDIPTALPEPLGVIVWGGSLVSAGIAFLSAAVFLTIRSYYRYRVLSRLERELSTVKQECRKRGLELSA